MKRYMMTILAVVLTTLGVKAMPYEMAREEAMYLTDKMAYELNLNQRQYEYVYEINLDYLMGLDRAEDAFGLPLQFRNQDLRHVLYDWQWNHFIAVDYFFHPVSWRYGRWYYPIYAHYAPNYFYYSRPRVYIEYRGGHGRRNYETGFYANRRPDWQGGFRGADRGHIGHPNMNGANDRYPGRQPNVPNMGNRGQQPNVPNMGNRTQQPNVPNTGNRGNVNPGTRQPNVPNMGTRGGGVQPSVPNMGTRTQQPNMPSRGTMGTPAGGATRGSMGGVSAGRGHR